MNEILTHNRVILCHFDTYSTALVFARYGSTVLAPSALPEGSAAMEPPKDCGEHHVPATALSALIQEFGLDAAQLGLVEPFQAWMDSAEGPIRVHLARFTTFEAPRELMEPQGAVFKPISELRGTAANELLFLRQAFNLIMGGG